jgi:hypothetical protein
MALGSRFLRCRRFSPMTWGQLTANRIAVTRFFCGMAQQFAVADLYQNAIDVNGHGFIRTRFKVRDAAGKRAFYYCPCGPIAIARNTGVEAVDDNGSNSELTLCRHFVTPGSRPLSMQ